ncbi:hypothetical protein [Rhodococcus sp. WS3]|uniref:hypothetical protein n=1 Tax=Rhodococcus sp. WS3 TaxID=2486271 RepID=UPI0021C61205|nr:hypothetical protein [Rhodococcus sp. WS3]
MINDDAPFTRSDMRKAIEADGIDRRTVWSGNVTRHLMMDNIEYCEPDEGLPVADAVFEHGMALGTSHGLTEDEVVRITESNNRFTSKWKGTNFWALGRSVLSL